MTYFDFMDFEPVRFISNSSFNRKNMSVGPKLTESPIHIEAAGFCKNDITAEIKNGEFLLVKGETSKYDNRKFEQLIFIPEKVDKKSIEVTVENGMITIDFKHKEKESLNIKVK